MEALTGAVQVESPGAGAEAVIGEPERAVHSHSLTGEAGGCGRHPDAAEVQVEHDSAVGCR